MTNTATPEPGSPEWERAASLETIRATKDRPLGFEERDALRRRTERLYNYAFCGSRFTATPAEIDAHLRRILAEDVYLRYQQAIGAAALAEAVEDVQTVRRHADNEGLFNADWREGWDDFQDRIDPDRNDGPYPARLATFGDPT